MAKPVIKFKTYQQSARVGGKIYGVPNLADPVVANVTMAEVIDYAKLHNYSADTLEALLSQVISGVADLVARDGRPRNLSDLLKFEPVIKGTFDSLQQTVTDQKVLVRPRLLKEIRVKLDASDYSWQNVNDTESPRIQSVAPVSPLFSEVNLDCFLASLQANNGFGYTLAGSRLAPNGWDASCVFYVTLERDGIVYHYDERNVMYDGEQTACGSFGHGAGDEATSNSIYLSRVPGSFPCWIIVGETPTVPDVVPTPQAGDKLTFFFARTLADGNTRTTSKTFVL